MWLTRVKEGGDSVAEKALFDRFVGRLEALARRRLGGVRSYEDEQDVAISALKSFLLKAPEGQFPQAADRDSLWALLAAITANKAASLQRRQLAEKRDIRRSKRLEDLVNSQPTAEFLESMISEGSDFLEGLDDTLREIARLRLEGYTIREIATQLDMPQTTVQRRLVMIRKILEAELE